MKRETQADHAARWERGQIRLRALVIVQSPAWIEDVAPVEWTAYTEGLRHVRRAGAADRPTPPAQVIDALDRFLDAAWRALPWRDDMRHALPSSVRAQRALAELVKAGACPYELLDLLQQSSPRAQQSEGVRPRRRRWSPARVQALAAELMRIGTQLDDLREEANWRHVRGFHSELPEQLAAEAERLGYIAPLVDGRSAAVDLRDAIQDHVIETTGQPHYLTLARLVGDDDDNPVRLAQALEQRRRRRLERKRLPAAQRRAVGHGDTPVSMLVFPPKKFAERRAPAKA